MQEKSHTEPHCIRAPRLREISSAKAFAYVAYQLRQKGGAAIPLRRTRAALLLRYARFDKTIRENNSAVL